MKQKNYIPKFRACNFLLTCFYKQTIDILFTILMRINPLVIYFLFFFSGMAGLIYEIVWSRLFVLIFGSTTNSIVAVIAAFLGGLAVGSLIFGKITDRLSQQNLLKTYSLLELGIGASALLSLFLIPKIRFLYSFFSDGSGQSLSLTIIKFS